MLRGLILFILFLPSLLSSQIMRNGDTLSVGNTITSGLNLRGSQITVDTTIISRGALLFKNKTLNTGQGLFPTEQQELVASFNVVDAVATEASTTTATVDVVLNQINDTSSDIVVTFTIGGTATVTSDYVSFNAYVTIIQGQSSASITITPVDDVDSEGTETITLSLTEGAGYIIGSPRNATVTITDDDTTNDLVATVSATDATATEASTTTGEYTVSLDATNSTGSAIVVNYTLGGSAILGLDYTDPGSSVSIANGTSSNTVTITPIDDTDVEGSETVTMNLQNGTDYAVGTPNSATITITDNNDTFSACTAGASGSYTPTSWADITNPSNANLTANISNSFAFTSGAPATGQKFVPAGGIISGTNINLGDACIEDNLTQMFNSSTSFASIYDGSRLSPEIFGAISGDAINDNNAIDALINNCSYATATFLGSYIKNNPSTYSRGGIFDWDMNGASVEITSTTNFRMTQVSVDAVFDMTNLSPTITNGEFDGNDLYGRLFYLKGQPTFSFTDLWIHDLYSPSPIRCVAFRFSINVTASGFTSGEFRDNVIEDIVSQGNGNYNDTDGISKAWWYSFSGHTTSTAYSIVHQGNIVRNIIGDDAEALYAIGGASVDHNGTMLLDNEDYRYCTRRAIKICVSNVTIQNSHFEEMPNSYYVSAQQMGSMIDFFSTSAGYQIKNLVFNNNTVRTVSGNTAHYYLMSFTEVDSVTVTNNVIRQDAPTNYSSLRLGSGTSSYAGILQNLEISGNTFYNSGIGLMSRYNPVGQMDISNNTFNYDSAAYPSQAAIRTTQTTGTRGNIDFVDNTINVNITSSSANINGVIYSAGSEYTNVSIDGVTVNYLDATVTRPFGYIVGNFGNTNTIADCTIVGDIGTESLVITGATQNPTITNSFGDGATAITVQ